MPHPHPHPSSSSSTIFRNTRPPSPLTSHILNWRQRETACRFRKDCKPLRTETLQRAGLGMKTCPLPEGQHTFTFLSGYEAGQYYVEKKRVLLSSGCLSRQSPIPAQHSAASHNARPGRLKSIRHSPSGLRQKSVEAEPCSFWMVQRYTPQSMGDACTMAKAAGPSSPALQRVETLLVRVITQGLRPNSHRLLGTQALGALGRW